MNIDKILEYQKKDGEAVKLQKSLDNNPDKKAYQDAAAVAKAAQTRSAELEKEAGRVIAEFEALKKTYAENSKSANVLSGKDLETADVAELDNISTVASDISSNLSILEKKILMQAEKVNAILSEFEQTKKKYNTAREKHKHHKALYEQTASKILPELERIEADLKKLEPEVDVALLEKYKQRKQDKNFPVFVPLRDQSCGGCMTEMPLASLEKLKKQGFMDCEYCRRVIYIK